MTQVLPIEQEDELRERFRNTRIEPILIAAPFIRYAFSKFIRLSAEDPDILDVNWLDREAITNAFYALYLLKAGFDDELWERPPSAPLPAFVSSEIDEIWSEVRRYKGNPLIKGNHPWTYLRQAWHEVSDEWLPGRRSSSPIRLMDHSPHAHYFKLAVAHCLHHLHTFHMTF